jgi:uncharacterized FlaG/YvyC family protein
MEKQDEEISHIFSLLRQRNSYQEKLDLINKNIAECMKKSKSKLFIEYNNNSNFHLWK